MTNKYFEENIIRITATFTDSGGTPTNPSSVFFAINEVSAVNSIDPSSIVNPSAGIHYYDYEVNSPAEYIYRWTGEGAIKARNYGSFLVNSIPFN